MKTTSFLISICMILTTVSVLAEDYYWTGGTGLWSDLNSWRTSTGQVPNEVPDGNDNVIFNENSFNAPFDTVYILTGNPTCKSMTWVNIIDTVVIAGGSTLTSFDVFGSMTMHPKVKNYYKGKIVFQSDNTGNTITCAKTIFHGDLRFEGTGEWILQDTLFLLDTLNWKIVIYGMVDSPEPNPTIQHINGRLDVNGQTIITMGFSTTGNKTREVDLDNGTVLMLGNWNLNGENLSFKSANSYILIGGTMYNTNGDEIHYNDIDFMRGEFSIKNIDIRTIHRKIHFLGSGTVDGKKSPGQEGMFTIDTLLFDGISGASGPAVCEVKGPNHNIHYTRIDLVHGQFDVTNGSFHRIDFNGNYLGGIYARFRTYFYGLNNTVDSCMYFHQAGHFRGRNTIVNVLFFNTEALVAAAKPFQNTVNHVIFSGNAFVKGNNVFDRMTLNTGYCYQFEADSLIIPGSQYSYSIIQTINQLEVIGDCNKGVCILRSDFKPVQAIIDYQGGPLTTDYLQVNNLNNIGQTMVINNGIDAGNNDGFVFNDPLQARNLYWVNGQGDWSSRHHWSLSSGGAGDQCPPTMLDDIFFDTGSGFGGEEDTVLTNVPHIHCHDMTWVDGLASPVHFVSGDTIVDSTFNDVTLVWDVDTLVVASDTCALHIHGSIELDPSMFFQFDGDVYFESEKDDDYETIDLEWDGPRYNLNNKVWFDGDGGKWKLKEGSKFYNLNDSLYFRMGDWLINDDTVEVLNFQSLDTVPRKLSMLDQTLFVVHQWSANAWNVNATPSITGDTLFKLDAGKSTIRSLGDLWMIMPPPGQCHVRTFGGKLTYHNIEFGYEDQMNGALSVLKSESKCTYNLVDYYYTDCDAIGSGIIDTLTWKPTSDNSLLSDNYRINFVMAYGQNDEIDDKQVIDTTLYFEPGLINGSDTIGYLEGRKFLRIQFLNNIDTAVLHGNAEILGKNYFSQLILEPNKRYIFQHENNTDLDTTFISDDFIVNGYCDKPIRIQSDSVGGRAIIFYERNQPTYQDISADYTSIRDISMKAHTTETYIATNSVDLGNNENWNFIETNNNVYYWVGGEGKWGDWQHWSFSSGGLPISERCTPREINTVVFDNNSFKHPDDTVFVDVPNAYCKNMWWNYTDTLFSPTFLAVDTTVLYVYGSMKLNTSLNYMFNGIVYFDQYNEPNALLDTIYSKNKIFWNDVYLQGIDDFIILDDDMTLFTDQPNQIYRVLYHDQGTFIMNGKNLNTGGYYSLTKGQRLLDMKNSTATVTFDFNRAWWVKGLNYELEAANSTLINKSINGTIATEKSDYFKYYNVISDGPLDSIMNEGNIVEYNIVSLNNDACLITGNYICDSVLMNGYGSGMFKHSSSNVAVINGLFGSVNNDQHINRCIVNKVGKINGLNKIKYCVFFDDGYFLGHNLFDTLVLYPGQGDFNNQGNWFYFQVDSTQVIIDSLYMRGNQCSNLNLATFPPNSVKTGYIRKDEGFDVSCDFLNIYNVGTQSANDLEFYAGINSTPLPDPTNPPPGWIFDNAQGYIPGFNGRTERFCLGSPYVIDAADFNGDPSTQYFWEGSQFPGNSIYTITEPGIYHIRVQYFEGCFVDDFINIEGDIPPQVSIGPGPFCEGDTIEASVLPLNGKYTYDWFTGDTTAMIVANLDYTGNIYIKVTDRDNKCVSNSAEVILVKPAPDPEAALGDDAVLSYGDSITLDAGNGDYFEWTSNPVVSIENPGEQTITVPGYLETVEYKVYVEINGCPAEGFKKVSMYPPSSLGVPTAFSPNGDGVNDVLFIKGTGFAKVDFKLFNRFGELVFETTDPAVGWDGNYKGEKQEMEVYTYHIDVVFIDNGVAEETGNITLLR